MITEADITAATDAAKRCVSNAITIGRDFVFWAVQLRRDDHDRQSVADGLRKWAQTLRSNCRAFDQSWTDDVKRAFRLASPDIRRRYSRGEGHEPFITAHEAARHSAELVAVDSEVAADNLTDGFDQSDGTKRFIFRAVDIANFLSPKPPREWGVAVADVEAEWVAAVRTLPIPSPNGERTPDTRNCPLVLEESDARDLYFELERKYKGKGKGPTQKQIALEMLGGDTEKNRQRAETLLHTIRRAKRRAKPADTKRTQRTSR